MEHNPSALQEPRSERGAVMLTAAEKRDAQLVAALDGLTESDVLRCGVAWVRQRAAQIRDAAGAAS